jgi:hypothetical protein
MLKNPNLSDLSPEKDASLRPNRTRLYSDTAVTSDDFNEIPIIDMSVYLLQREAD